MPETSIRPQELILLADELEGMFRAGLPLAGALKGASNRWGGRLRPAAQRLANQIENGTPLDEALQSAEELPPVFRALVASGLRSGRANDVLKTFSESARQLLLLREILIRGMMYPAIIVCTSFVLFLGLLLGLLPIVAQTFEVFRLDRPAWLRWGGLLRNSAHWWSWLAPLGVIALALIARRVFERRAWITGFGVPFGGRAVRSYQLSLASHLLAQLIEADVPLSAALKLAGETIGSSRIRRALDAVSQSVANGVPPAEALMQNPDVPPLWRSLFAASHGNSRVLVDGLNQVANSYGFRATSRAELVGRLLPALLVCIIGGGVTLLYTGALFVPLAQLWQRLSGGAI